MFVPSSGAALQRNQCLPVQPVYPSLSRNIPFNQSFDIIIFGHIFISIQRWFVSSCTNLLNRPWQKKSDFKTITSVIFAQCAVNYEMHSPAAHVISIAVPQVYYNFLVVVVALSPMPWCTGRTSASAAVAGMGREPQPAGECSEPCRGKS